MPDEFCIPSDRLGEQVTAFDPDPQATTVCDFAAAAIPASTATMRYVLGEEIARGGMGAVYHATDTAFGREVAVKVLLDKYAAASSVARRFQDEARITGQLQHPGIPPVHDLGTLHDGRPFLAMKLIKGDTLEKILKLRSNPNQDRGRFVAAFEQVCQAVAYAHAHGVIHRDLKPANVMVGKFGEVQVMDWGLAKVLASHVGLEAVEHELDTSPSETEVQLRDSEELLTRAGSVLGTPAYMPPEQAMGAIHEVDARSDVFGLGAILAVILTGRSPFVGDSAEANLVMAAQGEVRGCFERLDECEADPAMVALAKRCLSPRREDRPADAGAVANEVAVLRAAADDRARQAEVEIATAAAANAERRKRRRVWQGAAVALAVVVVGGLGAVLAVQRQANNDMAEANGKLATKNDALVAERAKVEQRFDMARKAIAAFHTTVDEQPELGNEAFRPLRKKLLGAAAGFYWELEGLLADEADPKSRAALADGYFQLAELTEKIGDKTEALVSYRKALALRRELAATPGADADTRLAVSETLRKAGILAASTGDPVGAQREIEEAREVAEALKAEAPTDAVRRALASSYHGLGMLFSETGKSAEAMISYGKSQDILQTLADAHLDVARYQRDLAGSHNNIGLAHYRTDKPAEALASCEAARGILQRLVDAHPDVIQYQSELAWSHNIIGILHRQTGDPAEALASYVAARAGRQLLADAHPAVDLYQSELAGSHQNIGNLFLQTDKPVEALASYEAARGIQRRLADAHPAVTAYQMNLVTTLQQICDLHRQTGKPMDALATQKDAIAVRQRLADARPADVSYQQALASSHDDIGNLLSQTAKPEQALEPYQRARDLRLKLVDALPADIRYQIDLAWSHNAIAGVLSRSGKPSDALASYEKARDVRQKLAEAQPTVTGYQANLASTHNNIGRLLAKEGRFSEAFAALDTGLAISEKLVAADDANTTQYASNLGYSHAYRGWARVQAGQPDGAAADLRRAVDLWAQNSAPDAEDQFEKSRALALLAKLGADPKSGVTADEIKKFVDQTVSALSEAVDDGWMQPEELREPDFDALRDRTDFQKLQAELQVRTAAVKRAPSAPDATTDPTGI